MSAEDFSDNDRVCLIASALGVPMNVMTTHGTIMSTIEKIKNESDTDKRTVYASTLRCILKYTRSSKLDRIYQTGGKKWKNLCNDIVLFYCCRYCLTDQPIPMCVTMPDIISAGIDRGIADNGKLESVKI
jgi:CO dehydrogenase/acetyl-CoA synthase beta subunit